MLRDTMMRTMPVAMIAVDALWTDRLNRLRGVRNKPPDMTLNPIQMIPSAPTMPRSRVSISVEFSSERNDGLDGGDCSRVTFWGTLEASAIPTPPGPWSCGELEGSASRRSRDAERGHIEGEPRTSSR